MDEKRYNPMKGQNRVGEYRSHPVKTLKTHIAEVPTLSAVVAPFVTCDITLPTFPERKQSF